MSYKSGYQGGPYFELLSTQGKDSAANWKISSSGIKKIYEKEVKGYVYTLEGAPATTKLQSPKDHKQSLTLVQRFLVVQIYIAKGADFSIELGVSDLGNNKRRINLSTSLKETQVTPLHAKVPLTIVRRAVWLNLVLDMVSLVGETWTNQTFRSIDQISISANCKLRRVFTMKSQPPDTTDDDELYGCCSSNNGELDTIPKQCQMASDVTQITQVLTLNKIKCLERLKSGRGPGLGEQFRPGSNLDLDLNASGRKVQTTDGRIAFGSKAPRAPPDSGRRTARQGSVTTRSLKTQIARQENFTNNTSVPSTANSVVLTSAGGGQDSLDFPRPRPPVSASAVSSSSVGANSALYNRQQSEPVTQEDYGVIGIMGLKENQIAPHPPREPSNDRFKRRPRIRSIGQNGALNKGDSSMASPPTSALVGQSGSRSSTALSPGTARSRVMGSVQMKDSGVGPDVPEIQSPRKGENPTLYDSVADVISLLKSEEVQEEPVDGVALREDGVIQKEDGVRELSNRWRLLPSSSHGGGDDNDSTVSTSASEGSHHGEYEESDEESSETNKLHLFISPPKTAPRRNISPADIEANKSKKSFVKSIRSNIKRGAQLKDDFVSRSSSEEDVARIDLLPNHFIPYSGRKPAGRHGGSTTSGYNSSNYTSSSTTSSKIRGQGSRSRPMGPKTSSSPDQKLVYDSRVYSDRSQQHSVRSSVSRMSKNFLREITNPHSENVPPFTKPPEKSYDVNKYQMQQDLSESFEARMFASMQRQTEEALEDISPRPHKSFVQSGTEPSGHRYSESPATTSDDDTSFSTWKAPAPNQAPHNYQDEMKSRRSTDTLTSSNPRDWSGVMSPPICPLKDVQDLQGTLEGISDDLPDENQVKSQNGLKTKEEEEKLDLYFDSKLNCYYDPKTQKWYELMT